MRSDGGRAAVFAPLESGRRADAVVRRLAEGSRLGLLVPDEQLPSETELADTFGVSPVTVREALTALREQGLVATRRGRGGGSFVRDARAGAAALHERLRDVSPSELRDLADHYVAVTGTARAARRRPGGRAGRRPAHRRRGRARARDRRRGPPAGRVAVPRRAGRRGAVATAHPRGDRAADRGRAAALAADRHARGPDRAGAGSTRPSSRRWRRATGSGRVPTPSRTSTLRSPARACCSSACSANSTPTEIDRGCRAAQPPHRRSPSWPTGWSRSARPPSPRSTGCAGSRTSCCCRSPGRARSPPRDVAPIDGLVRQILDVAGLTAGRGRVWWSLPDVLVDARHWMQWWTRDDDGQPQQLQPELDAEEESFWDYTVLPWFTVPRETGRRHVTGPYVDWLCTQEYTLTFTVPSSARIPTRSVPPRGGGRRHRRELAGAAPAAAAAPHGRAGGAGQRREAGWWWPTGRPW